jgi:hypothetical protein
MLALFGPRLRHPFFSDIPAVLATGAKGNVLAIAGTLSELEQAAQDGVVARRAVFVTHHWNQLLLTEAERTRLWRLFEVPIYAVVLDSWGSMVAYECEAQKGLHMAAGVIESALCDCGRPGKRPVAAAGVEPALSKGPASEKKRAAAVGRIA